MGRKKARFYKEASKKSTPSFDPNAEILEGSMEQMHGNFPVALDPLLAARPSKASKREREFERYVAKKLKKEERPDLFKRLQEASFTSDKLASTKNMVLADTRKATTVVERPVKAVVGELQVNGKSSFEQLHGTNPLKVFTVKPKEHKPIVHDDDESSDEIISPPFASSVEPSKLVPAPSKQKVFFVTVERDERVEEARSKLPIYAEEQVIMDAIRHNPVVIICGETGSGKTTQVPQFLFEAGYGHPESANPGMVGITQPRRVAAISTAERVQYELGIRKGAKDSFVGHQIRFDSSVGPTTRVKFMTDGILLKEVSADFLLTKYSVLILDEAHERNANTDILIGLLSRIVRMRGELAERGEAKPLKLVIMSATLNIDDFLNPHLFRPAPPILRVEARQHPVSIHFSRRTHEDYLEAAYKTVCKIHANLPPGGILVFLPGKQDIMELRKQLVKRFPSMITSSSIVKKEQEEETSDVEYDSLGDLLESQRPCTVDDQVDDEEDFSGSDFELDSDTRSPLEVLPLHSLLAPEQQQRVFTPPPEGVRLCVLATNIAETSITIPNIKYVVDCGKVKQKSYDGRNDSQQFDVVWCSKASATQRAGRAGRTGPGHCYRLFSSAVYDQFFPEFALPEIKRMPVESLALILKAMGVDNVAAFPLPSPLEQDAVEKAKELLLQLKAFTPAEPAACKLTKLGEMMSAVPLPPRWARLLILTCLGYGSSSGSVDIRLVGLAAAFASVLTVGDPFSEEAQTPRKTKAFFAGKHMISDSLAILSVVIAYSKLSELDRRAFCAKNELVPKKMEEISLQYSYLVGLVQNQWGLTVPSVLPDNLDKHAKNYLCRALCESLPDRIAERFSSDSKLKVLGPTYKILKPGPAVEEEADELAAHLHISSCLSTVPPRFIVFTSATRTAKGVFLRNVTAIDAAWIPAEYNCS